MIRFSILAALAVLLSNTPAPAQHMDKNMFLEIATLGDAEQKGLLTVYLRGVLNGLEASNMESLRRGLPQIFCPPSETLPTSAWLTEILLQYLERYSAIPSKLSIAVIAHHALAEHFPCKKLINN